MLAYEFRNTKSEIDCVLFKQAEDLIKAGW